MCLIGLMKEFDRVTIRDAIHLLHDQIIPLNLIRTIENMFKDNVAGVMISGLKNKQGTKKLLSNYHDMKCSF